MSSTATINYTPESRSNYKKEKRKRQRQKKRDAKRVEKARPSICDVDVHVPWKRDVERARSPDVCEIDIPPNDTATLEKDLQPTRYDKEEAPADSKDAVQCQTIDLDGDPPKYVPVAIVADPDCRTTRKSTSAWS